MSFGFDPSIILGASKASEGSIGDTLQQLASIKAQRAQEQHAQATLADMLRKQQQEQTLASIFRQNAGSMAPGVTRDLASAGFGPQAMAWQDQEAQMATKKAADSKAKLELETAYRRHIGELAGGVKDQAGLDALHQHAATSGDPLLATYFDRTVPKKYTPEGLKVIADQAVSPEKRAETIAAKERAEIMAGRSSFAPVTAVGEDGTPIVGSFNKGTGQVRSTGFGAPPKSTGQGGAKDWKDLTGALSTGARGSLSKDLQKSLNSAEALQTLLQMPDGSLVNATPQQMREAYTALNNLIAKGGSQAVSQIEHLAPETMASKFASAKQYLLNEPQGANAQEFIKNILDTAARETKLARKQLRSQQLQSLPNYAHLRKADPARFESLLRGVGIDPSGIDENGLEVAGAGGPAHISSDAEYDALPSGAEFIAPDGKHRRKP